MDDPYIRDVSPTVCGTGALVLVNGMWSKKYGLKHTAKWVEAIRSAGWKGSLHHLWWDASTKNAAPTHLNAWNTTRRRAVRVGNIWLGGLLEQLGSRPITLVGHSLGARVIHSGLLAGAGAGRVHDVILLGGAVRRKRRNWEQVGAAIEGRVVNVFNRNDMILAGLRTLTFLKSSPCGLKEIDAKNTPQIFNYDATQLIGKSSHSLKRYLSALPSVVSDVDLDW